jgi:type III restriction enzyme
MLRVDLDRIEDVAARLDLRQPNREAVESVVFEHAQWFDVERQPSPFLCVVDSATGVGKTYIIAGLIEYLAAARAVRNFAIICPNRTILTKTIGNFSPGHAKSIVGTMQSRPFVITAENFDTPATRAALDDDTITKLYIFTVQSLTKPTSKQGRKTHTFQEGLGAGFYTHLSELDDLVVLADEHHTYFGPAFANAIGDLDPHMVVGLTATPHKKTPDDQIVYRYPLAAAIADGFVKTPVIVGRRDDRHDILTKLTDGVTMLGYKSEFIDAYVTENDVESVNPVMLVIARNTDEADEFRKILESSTFGGGRWVGTTLTIHSNLSGADLDKALDDLAAIEAPDSPIRIVISVGMLKEGWDARNVYVIASMRASVSEVLTEQTLGRGLRLPFGKRTGNEMLDTLEVLAHERYQDLLKAKGVLNEQFVDYRTRAVLRENSRGQIVVTTETTEVSLDVFTDPAGGWGHVGTSEVPLPLTSGGRPVVSSVETRAAGVSAAAEDLVLFTEYGPDTELPSISVPRLTMTKVAAPFSLADITDLAPFRELGRRLAASPEQEFTRTKVTALVETTLDGMRRTRMVTESATDQLRASAERLPLGTLKEQLTDAVLAAPVVPSRATEARAVVPIITAFLDGLGANAEELLSAFGNRAAARLVNLVTDEHRKHLAAPTFETVVEQSKINWVRKSKRRVSLDPTEPFSKSIAYNSRRRSLYKVDWFDSSTERTVANVVDDSPDVKCWVRLLTGDLPVLWRSDGREYHADLVVVENSDDRWVVEVKADRDVDSSEVRAKRDAAKRWVNYVNAEDKVEGVWHYLLLSEQDVADAGTSWSALKSLGS